MNQAIDFIKSYNSFAVAAHLNPEGDAIGSTLGLVYVLRALEKTAYAYNGDRAPAGLKFLPGITELIGDVKDIPEVEAIVVLDCGDIDRPGPGFKAFSAGRPALNIDHHPTNTRFGAVNWVDDTKSSVGEMIAAMTRAMEIKIPAGAATCLYTAILTDTGSFQFPNTTPHTLRAAAEMVEAGASPELAAERYYHAKPASHLKLLAQCLLTLGFNREFTRGDAVITNEMFERTKAGPGASEGIVNMITDVETVKVAILFRQINGQEWKVSLRSKADLDVARLAKSYGGGGHKNAAGFAIEGPLDEVKKIVRGEVEKLFSE